MASTYRRSTVAAAIFVIGTVLAAGCKKPEAQQCGDRYCPAGTTCDRIRGVCIFGGCGDGSVQAPEACDGGNNGERRNTATCNSDCTLARCGDDIVNEEADEECDPGINGESDDCNYNCTLHECGDGILNKTAGEECDKGHDENSLTGDCLPNCKLNVCGDENVNMTLYQPDLNNPEFTVQKEDCDEGPQSIGHRHADCDYNVSEPNFKICSQCRLVDCDVHYCRDGQVDPSYEDCDVGDSPVDDECDYGQATCQVCNGSCQWVTRTGVDFCGNGEVETAYEECDAVASFACGTCGSPGGLISDRCEWLGRRAATGSLTVADNDGLDGEMFVLNDDVNEDAVTFQFVTGNDAPAGRVPIRITNSDGAVLSGDDIAERIRQAINGEATLRISASRSGSVVQLDNLDQGIDGNVRIWSVQGKVVPTGMGSGRGCTRGQPCAEDADCVGSLTCVGWFCQ